MVIDIGGLISGEDHYVQEQIAEVVEVAHKEGALVKVILENAYLTDEQKVRGCHLVEAAGADFVKTSTGYAPTGATIEDLKLMRRSVSPRIGIKAAHGIRTLDALLEVLEIGVTRVGATQTAAMLDEFNARKAAAAATGTRS
jgi:deoxyribose-phosphate aldolase